MNILGFYNRNRFILGGGFEPGTPKYAHYKYTNK